MSKWPLKFRKAGHAPHSRESRRAVAVAAPDIAESGYVISEKDRGPMCARKQKFTKVEAQSAINYFRRSRRGRHGQPEDLRLYQCPFCQLWHLTKS